jgi:hypothetical protein
LVGGGFGASFGFGGGNGVDALGGIFRKDEADAVAGFRPVFGVVPETRELVAAAFHLRVGVADAGADEVAEFGDLLGVGRLKHADGGDECDRNEKEFVATGHGGTFALELGGL